MKIIERFLRKVPPKYLYLSLVGEVIIAYSLGSYNNYLKPYINYLLLLTALSLLLYFILNLKFWHMKKQVHHMTTIYGVITSLKMFFIIGVYFPLFSAFLLVFGIALVIPEIYYVLKP